MKVRSILLGVLGASVLGAFVGAARAAEVKVGIDQVPAAVKATILKEGGKIHDIARKTAAGNTIYETDVIKGGKEIELRIAEDGKLITRKIEGDAEEEDDEREAKDEECEEEEKEGEDEGEETEAHREATACEEGMKALGEAKVAMLKAIETATKEGKGAKPFKADLEIEEGKPMFDIELLDGAKGPEMDIDAITGKVVKIESAEEQEEEDAEEGEDDSKEEQREAKQKAEAAKVLPEAKVTLAQAVEVAMKETKGGKAYKAVFKPEDGHPRYEVQVAARDKCMEVAICGISGAVLEVEPKGGKAENASAEEGGWRDTFPVDKANLVLTGKNPYFSLEPGHKQVYRGGKATLTITVLDETKAVDGVTTRVVEEREEKNGQPLEISRNFFAIDKTTGDVYYFGEEVDEYEDGKLAGHEGAWLSGQKGARFGLLMPAKPRVGEKFYQEMAPKVAMDRAEIVSLDKELKTPAGTFRCVYVKETSPLERGVSHKWYARGVGLVKDDEFVLVSPARSKE